MDVKMERRKTLADVPRYFQPYVNDCFANTYGAVLAHMGLNPVMVLADYLSFMYDADTHFIGANYLYRYSPSVEFTEEELNTSLELAYFYQTCSYSQKSALQASPKANNRVEFRMFIEDDESIAHARTKELIDSGKPVIAIVDLYEMSYHRAYQKDHGLHAVVITGYDDDLCELELFDTYPLSSSDFDGRLPYSEVMAGRRSLTPLFNPIAGEYRRPIRHLWVEIKADPQLQVSEDQVYSIIRESQLRMEGSKEVLGRVCGLPKIDEFRRCLVERKDETLDEQGIFLFKNYYNSSLKMIARSRKRFKAFLEGLGELVPETAEVPVAMAAEALEESAKHWDICAYLCLKLGIKKSMSLVDDLDKHLMSILELEGRVIENLEHIFQGRKQA
jgi:hypothetical protein